MTVILVEDDDALRIATAQALTLAGLHVTAYADAPSALAAITPAFEGAVVSDIRMPRMDGLQLLAALRGVDADIPVILVTGHGDVAMAVAALHDGAVDFLTKPFATDHLAASVTRAIGRRRLVLENRGLRAAAAAAANDDAGPLTGDSPAMERLRATVRQLAEADIDVLVEGETGTGKELVALMLHRLGPRRARPFIAVNCGALPEGLAEIELFGHAADSVAHTRLSRDGQIAASSGGTLLFDEIDSMAPAMQAKLLRVIEEREVLPIGANRPTPIDLRVVATCKRDLGEAVAAGSFRADLYYRLNTVRVRVPPLREREGDTLHLFARFVEEAKAQLGRDDFALTPAISRRLTDHDWPGNVRELRNFAFQVVLGTVDAVPAPLADLPAQVAAFEAAAIRTALERAQGRVPVALAELGIPRKTFYDKVARHGIDLATFRVR
ncbi:sigma-54 dependent transcriptional regulator [Sphingomonas donggukensis]|uniref:Sigma-54 dependent transcriptional regulator n=1 Tax=Sphingomonas donggukensis TaxID=2949093 RepID=A0ABY4TVI7_9SPHN|nr:sigma-54 dependent transcriptional regulator [Sphingomonas donggukensis]URW76406.1 sigma-54 dependent transcriptional regulator [Sphingomonas donggukensis]